MSQRLNESHFIFPDNLTPISVIGMIKNVLNSDDVQNKEIWNDPKMDWANYIYWVSLEYWINPIWILVSLQRERSLLGKHGEERDFDFAQGFVGQHGPGTKSESWDGLPSQIQLSARCSSWSLGRRPTESFRRGSHLGILPSWSRWNGSGIEIDLYSDKTFQPIKKKLICDVAEYVQLVFTPTEQWERLLDINGSIYEKWINPYWK